MEVKAKHIRQFLRPTYYTYRLFLYWLKKKKKGKHHHFAVHYDPKKNVSLTSNLLKRSTVGLKKIVFLHSSPKGLMIEKCFPRKGKRSPSSLKMRTKGRDQRKFYMRYYL